MVHVLGPRSLAPSPEALKSNPTQYPTPKSSPPTSVRELSTEIPDTPMHHRRVITISDDDDHFHKRCDKLETLVANMESTEQGDLDGVVEGPSKIGDTMNEDHQPSVQDSSDDPEGYTILETTESGTPEQKLNNWTNYTPVLRS